MPKLKSICWISSLWPAHIFIWKKALQGSSRIKTERQNTSGLIKCVFSVWIHITKLKQVKYLWHGYEYNMSTNGWKEEMQICSYSLFQSLLCSYWLHNIQLFSYTLFQSLFCSYWLQDLQFSFDICLLYLERLRHFAGSHIDLGNQPAVSLVTRQRPFGVP